MNEQIGKRLKEIRNSKGLSLDELAEKTGISQPHLSRLEAGSRRINMESLANIATALDVTPGDLVENREQEVPVVGYVGAGQKVIPLDDHALGEGLDRVTAPRAIGTVVAVIVKGDSMWPRYEDGDILFYRREDLNLDQLVNRECIVRLPDGTTYIKKLQQGTAQGLFTLASYNAAPKENIEIEWAARIRWVERN